MWVFLGLAVLLLGAGAFLVVRGMVAAILEGYAWPLHVGLVLQIIAVALAFYAGVVA